MKKIFTWMLAVSALFLLAACSNDEETADELIEYYNEEWIPIHAMKSAKMDDAQERLLKIQEEQEENYRGEAIALYKDEIIPSFNEVLERLKSVELEHKEVKKMNDLQMKAEEFGKTHLKMGIDYFNDDISDTQYMTHEDELKEKYDDVLEYRDKLIEKYDLKYDKEKDKVDGFYELKHKD
ncbi:hypothetical protein WMZ97_11930 [Lentibacillus sp. N15]|uniref:LptM family lipoprotein n=1 Tax=Lentibacillus songyuanensis TaxID=3136161 RepID=UPI0031BA9367